MNLVCLVCLVVSSSDPSVYPVRLLVWLLVHQRLSCLIVSSSDPSIYPVRLIVCLQCASPDCRELGSIELQEVAGSLRQTGRLRFLTIKCQGYEILVYTAGQKWVAVSATGEVVPVFYDTGNMFKGPDAAGNEVAIRTDFQVVQKE